MVVKFLVELANSPSSNEAIGIIVSAPKNTPIKNNNLCKDLITIELLWFLYPT